MTRAVKTFRELILSEFGKWCSDIRDRDCTVTSLDSEDAPMTRGCSMSIASDATTVAVDDGCDDSVAEGTLDLKARGRRIKPVFSDPDDSDSGCSNIEAVDDELETHAGASENFFAVSLELRV